MSILLLREVVIETVPSPARARWSPGHVAAAVVVVLATIASLGGLLADGFYTDGAWARSAFRGSDLATLAVAVPVLAGALVLSLRGSLRGRLVLLGMLAYSTYNYAFYAFGTEFSDWFLLHAAAFATSLAGLVLLAYELGARSVAARVTGAFPRRAIAAYLAAIGAVMGTLWVAESVRFALTGDLSSDAPLSGQHLVFALDLGFLVPGMLLAAVLLWRRHVWGYVAAVAMNVLGAVYQFALMSGAQFQHDAGVSDAGWFSPPSIAVAAFSTAAVVVLLRALRPSGG